MNYYHFLNSQILSTQYSIPNIQYSVPSTQYPVFSTHNLIPSLQYKVLRSQYSIAHTVLYIKCVLPNALYLIYSYLFSSTIDINCFIPTGWSRKIKTVKLGCIYNRGQIGCRISIFRMNLLIINWIFTICIPQK